MNKYLISNAQKMLAWANLSVKKLNDNTSVISLIKKLQPFATDINLIRFGPNGDGGYLIPEDLEGIEACFSPGVGSLFGFEKDCLSHGMNVFMADKSVDLPEESENQFHFTKKFIGTISNDDFMTMDDWVKSNIQSLESDLLLQMDIESCEYVTIVNMSDSLLKRFRIIVIEFHDLQKLWDKEFFNIAFNAFEKILQFHTCVHIHPNNCCGMESLHGFQIPRVVEITFLRNDRITTKTPQTIFPHILDFDSTSNPHLALPKSWYFAPK